MRRLLLLTGAPDCPAESATGSRQCNSLQCSLVHGSGRLQPTPQTEEEVRTRGTKQRNSPTETNNKRIKRQTNPQKKEERGRKSEWRVCVYCRGRQSSAILSHLSKLTRGDACKSKTQDRENRQRQTARKSTQHTKPNKKGRPGHQEGEEATNTNQDKR